MRHDEQVRLVKQLCAHLDAGTNVDAGDLPEPGSFITSNDLGIPILATRAYPSADDPGRHISRIGFYLNPHLAEGAEDPDAGRLRVQRSAGCRTLRVGADDVLRPHILNPSTAQTHRSGIGVGGSARQTLRHDRHGTANEEREHESSD